MRIEALDPAWIMRDGRKIGIRFICPINDGNGPHAEGHHVCVLFENPPDGGAAHPNDDSAPGNNSGRRWTLTGDILEMLTLSPSINCITAERCPKPSHERCSHAHCWHGFVTGGEVT